MKEVKERTVKDMPKWAQALFAKERIKGAHLWPAFDEPEQLPENHNPHMCWTFNAYFRSVEYIEVKGDKYRNPSHSVWMEFTVYNKTYATKMDAKKALRWELARLYAEKLATLDMEIEEELKNSI